MRHGKKFNHLKRKAGHRKALLKNLSNALIEHKRINTTLAKTKALRVHLEPIITKSKNNTTHSRRVVFSYLQNKAAVKELFEGVATTIGDRPGGYLRIIKTGFRKGDGAEMAMIEFVDYNTVYSNEKVSGEGKGKRKRRSRRGGKKSADASTAAATTATEEVAVEDDTEADDLTKIEGIGPKIQELLNNVGITTFGHVAETSVDDLKKVLTDAGGAFGSHDPGTWPDQAQMAADGNWEELKAWQDELDGGKEVSNQDEE